MVICLLSGCESPLPPAAPACPGCGWLQGSDEGESLDWSGRERQNVTPTGEKDEVAMFSPCHSGFCLLFTSQAT